MARKFESYGQGQDDWGKNRKRVIGDDDFKHDELCKNIKSQGKF